MTTIFIRTVIIYVFLMSAMRFMGKRQIGELEVSDLVATLLISEIASLPITDNTIPISHAIIPMFTVVTFEIISSALVIIFPKIKSLVTARPTTLINEGKLCRKAMLGARISIDELITELRQSGYLDINEIHYAILEKNGKITLIPKQKHTPPTCEQLNVKTQECSIFHIIIDNGVPNAHGLEQSGLSLAQLEHKLQLKGHRVADVYLMMVNGLGEERLITKKEAS